MTLPLGRSLFEIRFNDMTAFRPVIRVNLSFGRRTNPKLLSLLAGLEPANRARRVRAWVEDAWRLEEGQIVPVADSAAKTPVSRHPHEVSSSAEPTVFQGTSLEDGIAAFLGQRIL